MGKGEMTMSELKPCPFCGCEDIEEFNFCGDLFYVQCTNCSGCVGACDTAEEAVEEWNRRDE